ncbi:LPS translocon maturation chaperone LptM [Brachymonas denitrificans]|jgi:predicted small lipoprotein YifL|uniref:Lipoprotein-attachment site-containing protein n=1 Tax=Brachymonas denitrificans DSM 15123 TaxID=1121117 RepID=A0A1H8DGK0_9BURK|nr:lipoprotein [Brachymonas denitrificans]SEN06419.1 hypothetical protein SAMN02745977_00317 [Brachymonas denitrificans DSM 15123]
MLNVRIIVNSALLGLCCTPLMGCGQKGPLYLPTAPEAAHRATLPETLLGPVLPRARAATPAASAASASVTASGATPAVAPLPAPILAPDVEADPLQHDDIR